MLRFTKMNGNGNDFLVLDNRERKFSAEEMSRMAQKLCRRREAIGADGILVVEPSQRLDFTMRLFNRDGSEGEMCGNGARCLARYAFEEKIAGAEMSFETLGGDQHAVVDGKLVALDIAPVCAKDAVLEKTYQDGIAKLTYSYLIVGVPHVVVFEDSVRPDEEYTAIGRRMRSCLELFPQGANINFAVKRPDAENSYTAVTYERGVEELTLSCGTGSVAISIAAYLTGRGGETAEIHNPGGINRVRLVRCGDEIKPTLEGLTVRAGEISATEEIL